MAIITAVPLISEAEFRAQGNIQQSIDWALIKNNIISAQEDYVRVELCDIYEQLLILADPLVQLEQPVVFTGDYETIRKALRRPIALFAMSRMAGLLHSRIGGLGVVNTTGANESTASDDQAKTHALSYVNGGKSELRRVRDWLDANWTENVVWTALWTPKRASRRSVLSLGIGFRKDILRSCGAVDYCDPCN